MKKGISQHLPRVLLACMILVIISMVPEAGCVMTVQASAGTQESSSYRKKEAKGIAESDLAGSEKNELGRSAISLDAASSSYSEYSDDYGYTTLNAKGKKVYQAVKSLAYSFHDSTTNANSISYSDGSIGYVTKAVDVSSYNVYISDVEKIMFAFEADNPMIYWYEGITYTYNNNVYKEGNYYDKKIKTICISVSSDYRTGKNRKATTQSIKNGLKPYLTKINAMKKEKATDMEIELAIHDMIVESVDYAVDTWGNAQSKDWAHNIEGLFTKKGAVCEGYAKGFHMLLHYAGIDSVFAAGWGSGEAHAWNLVKIGGKWYNVDVTWDDRGSEYPEYYAGVMYDYFNCLNDVFLVEHTYDYNYFNEMYNLPTITSNAKYSYYSYYNLELEHNDLTSEEQFVSKIEKAITSSHDRMDYVLRLCVPSNELSRLESVYNTYMTTVHSKMNSNGSYMKMSSAKYSQMDNEEWVCYIPISIITVSKISSDSVYFSNIPFTVTEYEGKSSKDLTNLVTTTVSGNQMKITYGQHVLATYSNVAVIDPVIALETDVFSFSGGEIKPNLSVSSNGVALVQGTDYQVTYQNNTNTGTASVIVTGIGSYKGSKTVTFRITPKKISQVNISKIADQGYTGANIIPKLTIRNGKTKLVKDKDYTVSGKNNKGIGTASLTIRGKGNYTGKKTVTFQIKQRDIKTCTFSKIDKQTYTGKLIKPSLTVKAGSTKLKQGKEYKITYSNNKKIGRAKIVVQGITKNIVGKKTLYFNIVPAKVTKVKASSSAGKTTVSWNSISYASGYEVLYATTKNGRYKELTTAKKNTMKTSKLAKGKKYYIKVRAYKVVSRKKLYGEFSEKFGFKVQ